jgi:tetratricopeptide (TPR) repeat protein
MGHYYKAPTAEEHIADLKSQLARNTECGTTHYNLAVALMGRQEYDEAEKELHAALECSPNLAEAYVLLGGICLQRNDMEGCLRYNRHAVKARAGFAEGHANIGFVLIQLCRGDGSQDDEEKLDMAIKNLKKAIIYNGKFVQAFTSLGTAYFMKGLLDESIKANQEALAIVSDFPIAHNNLAVAYLEKKDFPRAILHCDRALELGFAVPKSIREELQAHRS